MQEKTSKAAAPSEAPSGSNSTQGLLVEIKAVGDSVRQLKLSGGDQAAVDAAVAQLLSLKAAYKAASGQDWNPNLLTQAPMAAPVANGAPEDPAFEACLAQGNAVRALKDAKAPKAEVDAAVAKLLELKAEYKAKTGKDYAPPAAPKAPKASKSGGKAKEQPKKAKPAPAAAASGHKQTK